MGNKGTKDTITDEEKVLNSPERINRALMSTNFDSAVKASGGSVPTYTYKPFTTSDTYASIIGNKDAAVRSLENLGAFAWDNQIELDNMIEAYKNRDKFSYDLNADMLYKQYADKYMRQGQMAMMDTMGQASMMTGGYGNSYAQSVGQQAYQSELQNLNDIVPQLYELAYSKYQQEGQDMLNEISLLAGERAQAYQEYTDERAGYLAEIDLYGTEANNQYARELTEWENDNAYASTRAQAFETAKESILSGIMPSDDLLATAGIDRDTAQGWVKTALIDAVINGTGDTDTGEKWGYTFMGIDKEEASDGTFIERARILMPDGSVQIFDKGTNPYTGTSNKDIADGTWDNGYQPDNIGGKKLEFTGVYATNSLGEQRKVFQLSKLVPNPDYGNGSTDKYIDEQSFWIWEDKQNRYVQIEFEDIED